MNPEKPIRKLVADVLEELERLHYAEGTRTSYRRFCRRLIDFADSSCHLCLRHDEPPDEGAREAPVAEALFHAPDAAGVGVIVKHMPDERQVIGAVYPLPGLYSV